MNELMAQGKEELRTRRHAILVALSPIIHYKHASKYTLES